MGEKDDDDDGDNSHKQQNLFIVFYSLERKERTELLDRLSTQKSHTQRGALVFVPIKRLYNTDQ